MKPALLLLFAITAWAQSGSLGRGYVATDDVRYIWDTRVEPAQPRPKFNSFGAHLADDWIVKTMLDRTARVYFGYLAQVSKDSRGIHVEFRPLNLTPELAARLRIQDDVSTWKTWAIQVPSPQILKPGDVIAIELMTNPTTGQKIVDYVSVLENEPTTFANAAQGAREFSFVGGDARDFRVEDAELRLMYPRLTVTGSQGATEYRSEAGVSGAVAWFYIAGKGRYLLSVLQRPGFQRLGDIRGTILRFALGGETFNLSSSQPILGGGPYNLYVLHEPNYRGGDQFAIGAQDFWK